MEATTVLDSRAGVLAAVRAARNAELVATADQLVHGPDHEVGLVRDTPGEIAADQRRLGIEPGRIQAAATDQGGRRDGLHGLELGLEIVGFLRRQIGNVGGDADTGLASGACHRR